MDETQNSTCVDLVASVQELIYERDALRERCERQARVLQRLQELMGELQEFIDTDLQVTAPESRPSVVIAPDDATVAAWAAEYDAGAKCAEIGARYGVSAHTISGHLSQWRRRQRATAEAPPDGNGDDPAEDDAEVDRPHREVDLYPLNAETHCLRCGVELTPQNRRGSFCRTCLEASQERRRAEVA